MGYRLGRTYSLQFQGAMAGAEVKLRSANVATVLELRRLIGDEDRAALVELLADNLLEWNLEDADGEPVPPNAAGILEHLEEVVLGVILREWYKAATGVTAPLDEPSTDSAPSVELSIPMEMSSASLPN
jgi:hypothetical protein